MTSVLLVYPFFRRSLDRSRFRFPPLGIAYVASALRAAGHDVRLVDCTFLRREEALARALAEPAEVTGIYAMSTMEDDCDWMAARLRAHSPLLVAGGPLPTCEPERFLRRFDAVVRGEAESTMVELLAAHEAGAELCAVPGVVCRRTGAAPPRPFASDLDACPSPPATCCPTTPTSPSAARPTATPSRP